MNNSLKACRHEGGRSCRYDQLRKEGSKEVAKRLSDYADLHFLNSDEYCMRHSSDFWEEEMLVDEYHKSYVERIVIMARDMRIPKEIEMIPILTQRYFIWVEEYDVIEIDYNHRTVTIFIEDLGMHLHEKTMRMLHDNIKSLSKLGVKSIPKNKRGLDQKIKKFIHSNPRRYSISGTKKIESGALKLHHSLFMGRNRYSKFDED